MRSETDRGFHDFSGNELTIGSTIDDPAAVRVASPSGTNKISGNVLTPQGTQLEKTLLVLTQDDSGGCYDFQAQLPGRTDDKGMIRLARLSPQGFELFVPIIHSTQAPPPPPPPDGSDPTHGIPDGDFGRILEVYGFASDLQEAYGNARVTWVQVIARQDERDDYRHFPQVVPMPETPQADPFTPAERLQFVSALGNEFGFPPDTQSAGRYIAQGHSPSFRELHNDMLPRNDGRHDATKHDPRAPY
jgi:hypothetical protein